MTQTGQENEIYLADIWAIINRYKKTILAVPIICSAVAYILLTFVIAPQWEASAVLQIGQIGPAEKAASVANTVSQIGQIVPAEKAEPVANVIVRMQHPSFISGVMHQASFKPEEFSAVKALYAGSLKVTQIKNTELLELKLRGYSPDTAKILAANTVSYLQKIHGDLISKGVARIEKQIQFTDEEIQSLKQEMNALDKQLMGKRDWNSYNATLATAALQEKTNHLRELTQRKRSLDEQLNPAVTFVTKLFTDISVSEGPVAPKKSFVIGMASLLGLFGGVFIAFAHNALCKSNRS